MSVTDSVRQAIAAGAIAQSTIDELQAKVFTPADSRSLAILADAICSKLVSVVAQGAGR
jgi:hypothetical protein